MSGILYGIGVGPGDPELLTLKAVRTIRACDVVILPTEPKEDCYAYRIVKDILPEIDEKEILCRHFPMIRDPEQLARAHAAIYADISGCLEKNKKVAFLTIGDPSLYSTFSYIHERAVEHGFLTEVIAGVPSICAAAARAGIPLGGARDEIHIIPGAGDVRRTLAYPGTKVYMKSGKQLHEIKKILEEQQSMHEIWAVSNCGMADEKVMCGLQSIDADSGYLTIIIVKENDVRSS